MPMLPVLVPPSFRIIAHRGASGYAPENTLSAFLLAERMSIAEIELDVQFSSDHQLVIVHDEVLDRYGYPGRRVAGMTLSQILSLDMGSWFSPFLYHDERALSLVALFQVFGKRFTYHIEIKAVSPELPKALLDCMRTFELCEQAIITSFHYEILEIAKKLAPNLRVGWLLRPGQFTLENIGRAAEAGFFQICPLACEVNQDIVAAAHQRLPEVRVHSVRGRSEMLQAIRAGSDGMTINWPDWLVHEE
jgi:glycerophosphoryl diester phosphodiesterase